MESITRIGDCWNRIGVFGDHSCPELKEAVHCHNCFVYYSAGRVLLERKPSSGSEDETRSLFSERQAEESADTLSYIIFRLENEYFALPTKIFVEASEPARVHTLPHIKNNVLRGITCIRGEILLCFSMQNLLRIVPQNDDHPDRKNNVYPRMLIIEKEDHRWVFEADEVTGLYHCPPASLEPAPVTIAKDKNAYVRNLTSCDKQNAGVLDENLIFKNLSRYVS